MNARRKRFDWFIVSFAIAGTLLLLFIVVPLLTTLIGTPADALWQALVDADVQASVALTFYAAACATGLAMLTGVPLAYLLARHNFTGKRWIEGIINLPIVVPHTAAGIALLMVFGRQAPVGQTLAIFGLRFTDGVPGIVVAMLFVSLPYLVNAARQAFALIDPELERVAMVEGASQWQAFVYVTLPLAWRGIMAGAVMMWGRGISEFGAVVILAYNPKIIPVLVYEYFAGFGLTAALPLTVILILASLGIFVFLQILFAQDKEAIAIEE
ncbi:MAG: ABC transporter permease [Chloroflexi bacterium]|nr:ABC transporter permease [Chloroflexota bacterium]